MLSYIKCIIIVVLMLQISFHFQQVCSSRRLQSLLFLQPNAKLFERKYAAWSPFYTKHYSKQHQNCAETDLELLEKEIFDLAGAKFNLRSPKQTATVLFNNLGLPYPGQLSKSGQQSTALPILEALVKDGHLLPAKILEWRKWQASDTAAGQSADNSLERNAEEQIGAWCITDKCENFLECEEAHVLLDMRAEARRHRREAEAGLGSPGISGGAEGVELPPTLLPEVQGVHAFCPGAACAAYLHCESGQVLDDLQWSQKINQAAEGTRQPPEQRSMPEIEEIGAWCITDKCENFLECEEAHVLLDMRAEARRHQREAEAGLGSRGISGGAEGVELPPTLLPEVQGVHAFCPGAACAAYLHCESGQVLDDLQWSQKINQAAEDTRQPPEQRSMPEIEEEPSLSNVQSDVGFGIEDKETKAVEEEWAALRWTGPSKDKEVFENKELTEDGNPDSGGEDIADLYIVDGTWLVFRSYFSMPPLTKRDGTPVGALVGFCNQLNKLALMKRKKDNSARRIVVVFDTGKPTFRKEIFEAYKANRGPIPEDIRPQFELVKQACEAYSIATVQKEGFEADDVIATLAKEASIGQGSQNVFVVTGDKDLVQLIDSNVRLFDIYKNQYIGHDEALQKYGVRPDQMIDFLALTGDASDNIPGIPSIGPKTAAKLLNEHDCLETVLEKTPFMKKSKLKEALAEHADKALLSQKLVTLCCDVSLDLRAEQVGIHSANKSKIFSFCDKHELKDLKFRIGNILQ